MKNIITLTTDFGTKDGYVGAMKGKILSINPNAKIIDITHEISPQNIREASWTLLRSTPLYPKNTIHVAVIDPGVGSMREAIVIQANDQWYIGPDNGLFTQIVKNFKIQNAYKIHKTTKWWNSHSTFDGLALFSPAAAYLSIDTDPKAFGQPISNILRTGEREVERIDNKIVGEIILFDHFGNAISNIHKNTLEGILLDKIEVTCNDKKFAFATHYSEVEENSCVSLFNSDNFLELSENCGSIMNSLKLQIGDKIHISIK